MSVVPEHENTEDMDSASAEKQYKSISRWKRRRARANEDVNLRESAFINFCKQCPEGTPKQVMEEEWHQLKEEERVPYAVKNIPRPVDVVG